MEWKNKKRDEIHKFSTQCFSFRFDDDTSRAERKLRKNEEKLSRSHATGTWEPSSALFVVETGLSLFRLASQRSKEHKNLKMSRIILTKSFNERWAVCDCYKFNFYMLL